ncbi:branched-chain amino acid ABC transporter permease [Candidatus Bathyarchaeota archaeon]|nr:branched-chain amino acid ABC transporter permease [Candidatus Bathyarchaeota archaeon]MBS7631156.1 branched-chain amino acid ABC transporter permease [Candidatus Bathyarchaeota archaeon]
MIGILGNLVSEITGPSRLIIDIAMFFGLQVIVAMALNFQYGNAGVPNMGCAFQVITGAFTVSAITTRLAFWFAEQAGIQLLPYNTGQLWMWNSNNNVFTTNKFLAPNAGLSISLLLFSLAVSLVLGALIGYVISLPAIRLRATYLIIVLIALADASQIFGRNVLEICGGPLGMYVPNVFGWYPGDRSLITAIVTMTIGLISFFIFRTMLNSPYGRLMRAIRENEVTVGSVGKNVTGIRRNVLMFASGITALVGVLNAFYASFVVEGAYQRAYWTYWPWLMLILGGPGNNAGTFIGTAAIIALRRIIIVYKFNIESLIFFPISYFEEILLGVLLIVVMIFRPSGLIPEKLLYIPGLNYSKLVREEVKVDWRAATKARKGKSRFSFRRKEEEE